MIEWLQDRVLANGIAVFEHPLDFTNPHGDACEFGGIRINFNAQHIGGRTFDGDLPL